MSYPQYPYQVGTMGRTAQATYSDHIRDMVEQVLFTAPGERVNRPQFGTGLMQLVFEGGGQELGAAVQLLVQSALQTWLGTLIEVETVDVSSSEGELLVTVEYVVLRDGQRERAEFVRGGEPR